MVAEARKLTRGGYLIVEVSHQIKALLIERASKWMTSARLLQYDSCLMEQEDLEFKSGENFNPASCLNGPEEKGGQDENHDCIQVTDLQTRARKDLRDTPWPEGENVFIDGSSRVIGGKRFTGYSVVNGRQLKEGGRLLPTCSAQTAELCALVRACEFDRDKTVNVFTDINMHMG